MHVVFRLGVLDVCQIICGLPFVWRGVLRRFLALPDGFVVKFVQANFKDHSLKSHTGRLKDNSPVISIARELSLPSSARTNIKLFSV